MDDNEGQGVFQDIPDSILLEVFGFLNARTLVSASMTCTLWNRVALDDSLWKRLVQHKFNICGCLPPGRISWRDEYKRMTMHVPRVKSEVKNDHMDEVLDVTFSHDGKVFCTTSKDGTVKLWKVGYPTQLIYKANMLVTHGWNLTQYSVFNKSDTLLCVCGVKYPDIEVNTGPTEMGKGAVFRTKDFQLLQTMNMDPPHLFCDWFDDSIILSGDIVDTPGVLKIKAFQVLEPDRIIPFDSSNNSAISYENVQGEIVYTLPGNYHHTMNLLVANVPIATCQQCATSHRNRFNLPVTNFSSEVIGNLKYEQLNTNSKKLHKGSKFDPGRDPPFRKRSLISAHSELDSSKCLMCGKIIVIDETVEFSEFEKVLIYVSGEHDQITLHKLNDLYRRLDYIKTMKEEQAEAQTLALKKPITKKGKFKPVHRGSVDNFLIPVTVRRRPSTEYDGSLTARDNDDTASDGLMLDVIGHKWSMPNLSHLETPTLTPNFPNYYISGLHLSKDNRLLYFNYRLRLDAVDSDGYPALGRELAIEVYNLQTLEHISGLPFCGSHSASSSYPAWYICLDTCADYIVSGSEDAHAYLWDKRYGCLLGKYRHEKGVVNGVAFSPADPETLVTVADDTIINIWRSKNRENQLRVHSL